MPFSSSEFSTVHQLAKRLEQDIRRRGLQVGDRYLTAHEAADMLGVSQTVMHRAMKLLADSDKLRRRQRLGTFVGPRAKDADGVPDFGTVYILVPAEMRGFALEHFTRLLSAIREETACTNVNYGFVPQPGGAAYVEHLVKSGAQSGRIVGIVAVSCPGEVYRYLATCGVPAMVWGSLYHDTPPIPSADVDNREAGRLLAEYLVQRGHQRIALFATAQGRPGDHEFLDGASDALSASQLPANTIAVRVVPHDRESCRYGVRQLLISDKRPTGLIGRGEYVCRAMIQAVKSVGLNVPGQVELVFQESWIGMEEDIAGYPCVVPKANGIEIGRLTGRVLKGQGGTAQTTEMRTVIPVELRDGWRRQGSHRRNVKPGSKQFSRREGLLMS